MTKRKLVEQIEEELLYEMQELFKEGDDESTLELLWDNGDWVIVVTNLHCPDEGDTRFMISVYNESWSNLWFSDSLIMYYDRGGKLTPFQNNVKELAIAIADLIVSIDKNHVVEFENLLKSGLLLKKSLDYEID